MTGNANRVTWIVCMCRLQTLNEESGDELYRYYRFTIDESHVKKVDNFRAKRSHQNIRNGIKFLVLIKCLFLLLIKTKGLIN